MVQAARALIEDAHSHVLLRFLTENRYGRDAY
jgi:hypothetical protein